MVVSMPHLLIITHVIAVPPPAFAGMAVVAFARLRVLAMAVALDMALALWVAVGGCVGV